MKRTVVAESVEGGARATAVACAGRDVLRPEAARPGAAGGDDLALGEVGGEGVDEK